MWWRRRRRRGLGGVFHPNMFRWLADVPASGGKAPETLWACSDQDRVGEVVLSIAYVLSWSSAQCLIINYY